MRSCLVRKLITNILFSIDFLKDFKFLFAHNSQLLSHGRILAFFLGNNLAFEELLLFPASPR